MVKKNKKYRWLTRFTNGVNPFDECPQGYQWLINDLCEEMDYIYKLLKWKVRRQFGVLQAKEKFGKLRVYVTYDGNDPNPLMEGIIEIYQNLTEDICPYCGSYLTVDEKYNYVNHECRPVCARNIEEAMENFDRLTK